MGCGAGHGPLKRCECVVSVRGRVLTSGPERRNPRLAGRGFQIAEPSVHQHLGSPIPPCYPGKMTLIAYQDLLSTQDRAIERIQYQQMQLALSRPDEHGEGLHPSPRHGTVLLWQQRSSRQSWKKVEPNDDLAKALAGHAGRKDRFMSVNEFNGWRQVKLLRSLRACYVDLDDCRTVEAALDAVDDAVLPRPSYAVHSGRGVHLYWLLEAVPAKALPVWQAIQTKLIASLASVGADRAASDCTRVLRLVGTINSKSNTEVLGYVIEPGRWTLRQLASEVLGHSVRAAAPVASIERARAIRRAVLAATGPFQLWHSRYVDLCTIADHHAFMRGGLGEGNRDKLLFLMGTALSWFTRTDTLRDEINRVALTYTPTLTPTEVGTYTRPILRRAMLAAEGKTLKYDGQERDARYAFKTETLREWLGDLITPAIEPQLRVLLPREQLKERKRASDAARWKQDRARYLAQFQVSKNAAKPWEALGMSRATYFRRQAAGTLPAQ